MEIPLIIFGAFVLLFVFVILRNKRINGDIDQNGIETDAVVSRVTETVSSDSDGMVSISHTYYVTYRAMNGQTAEAQLGSGKSVDFRIGKKTWDHDLQEGTPVRIKYLPEKTYYAIRVG